MTRIPITTHTANVLRWLGTLYRDPADALKEHVSNAIDEHKRAKAAGQAQGKCRVVFVLRKDSVTVSYPYGMSREEFAAAMKRVADSAKRDCDIEQIGRLGIGMFGFLQFGRKCTILSKKAKGGETFRAVLREGSDEAEMDTARKKESLPEPGISIAISELKVDPTKMRGPLSLRRLQRLFAEKFAYYLREGSLEITLRCGNEELVVEPERLELPRVGKDYATVLVRGNAAKAINLELYFEPSGKGRVGIRNMGVVVVEDIAGISAYGLEESVFANGSVRGFIDADFLEPLPARSGFAESEDWTGFLDELDRLCPLVQAEVDALKQQESRRQLTAIQLKAMDLAREILDIEDLKDLDLLGGLRKPREPRLPPNGFDFVPDSIRLAPGEKRKIPLKALVPEPVPDGASASLSISEPFAVGLLAERVCFTRAAADEDGVVSYPIELEGRAHTMAPAILTARCGALSTQAHIRVAEPGPSRESRNTGPRFNFVESHFSDRGLPVRLHSFFKNGTLEVNEDHPHYAQAKHRDEKLAYAALMIGKETLVLNCPSAADSLERMLTFYFELRNRITGQTPSGLKRPRGRPKKM